MQSGVRHKILILIKAAAFFAWGVLFPVLVKAARRQAGFRGLPVSPERFQAKPWCNVAIFPEGNSAHYGAIMTFQKELGKGT